MQKLFKRFREASAFSKLAVKMGALMMAGFYITGIVAYIIAPEVPNYFGAMSVFRGSMEAAPASLAAGFCAAVLSDLVSKNLENRK